MNNDIQKILSMISVTEIVDLIRDVINDPKEIDYWVKWGVSKANREVLMIDTALLISRRLKEKIEKEIEKESVV
ncbi:MAG: hypothetical protein KatS3mg096_759 [Candidatus Parcubacteria bacterium]|nr:MAG: hypothetical protein KatS3mg096_759 [Candidatus Parcubacteria bacterium]